MFGDVYIFLGQQQIEEIVDGGHRHLFGFAQEVGLRLRITHRLYTAVPLKGICPEDGLAQSQGDGDGHVSFVLRAVQLLHEVQRSVQRERTSGKPDVLVDGEIAGHLREVVPHKGIRAVALLVTVVTLGIAWYRCLEVHLGQQIGLKGSVLPIGRFQLVQCHGRIHTLHPCQGNGFIQCDGADAGSGFCHCAEGCS